MPLNSIFAVHIINLQTKQKKTTEKFCPCSSILNYLKITYATHDLNEGGSGESDRCYMRHVI